MSISSQCWSAAPCKRQKSPCKNPAKKPLIFIDENGGRTPAFDFESRPDKNGNEIPLQQRRRTLASVRLVKSPHL
jgi:hypothetical protein